MYFCVYVCPIIYFHFFICITLECKLVMAECFCHTSILHVPILEKKVHRKKNLLMGLCKWLTYLDKTK